MMSGLELLNYVLFHTDKKVVFITGAGISVKSGIPLYRSDKKLQEASPDTTAERSVVDEDDDGTPSKDGVYISISDDEDHDRDKDFQSPTRQKLADAPTAANKAKQAADDDSSSDEHPTAIWDHKLEMLAQKRTFLLDPRSWYELFWFDTHHVNTFLLASPNESHFGIAVLSLFLKNRIRCITQNVDNLHLKAGIDKSNLIEIHGRVGLYRCAATQCEESVNRVLRPRDLDFMTEIEERAYEKKVELMVEKYSAVQANVAMVQAAYKKDRLKKKEQGGGFSIMNRLPCCPTCHFPVMPLTLLFDESYQTNVGFQMPEAIEWLNEADVVVFCGTSFSVYFPELAVNMCRQSKKLVFNINVRKESNEFDDFIDLSGPRDLTRRAVVQEDQIESGRIELDFESLSEGGSEPDSSSKARPAAPAPVPRESVEQVCRRLLETTADGPCIQHIVKPADEAIMAALDTETKKACLRLMAENTRRVEQRLWEAP